MFPSEKHEFESVQDLQILNHLTSGLGVATTPYLALDIPPHPIPSHLINLTLYKGQCIARNIYSRHMALSIFLWLIY